MIPADHIRTEIKKYDIMRRITVLADTTDLMTLDEESTRSDPWPPITVYTPHDLMPDFCPSSLGVNHLPWSSFVFRLMIDGD